MTYNPNWKIDPQKALAKLGKKPPKEIIELRAKVDKAIKEAEEQADRTGTIAYSSLAIEEIVFMKRKLDELYCLWIEDKI